MLNIVIPMAGKGSRFKDAGYAFPKPLIDVSGKTMIEVVVNNLRPSCEHRFIFICQREHFEQYDLHNILKNATKNRFEVVLINGMTEGAACTVLTAIAHINNGDEMVIANSDQYIEKSLDSFVETAHQKSADGLIMTFKASHPKWSYARTDRSGKVLEVAEKKVISNDATVGIYYFKKGRDFVKGAESMIHKNIRSNNEFYVCPVYNELIIEGKNIFIDEISADKMHGLGTPEDLNSFLGKIEKGSVTI
jgi:dTDP-glucose pyrophosphorylase